MGIEIEDRYFMPRTRNVFNTDFPYHINARTNDGLPFPCDLSDAWEIYGNALWFYSRIFKVRVLAFVMMNNHFHLLISTPEGNLSEFMKHFMKRTSDDIRSIRGVKNHLYGDRYYPSIVSKQDYFQSVLKYIYQNPVRARLCKSVLDYEYSSLRGFIGSERMQIPIFDDYNFFDNLTGNLNWLDTPMGIDKVEIIRTGLKRQEFSLTRDKNGFKDDTLLL